MAIKNLKKNRTISENVLLHDVSFHYVIFRGNEITANVIMKSAICFLKVLGVYTL